MKSWQANQVLILDGKNDPDMIKKTTAARIANLAIKRIMWLVKIQRGLSDESK